MIHLLLPHPIWAQKARNAWDRATRQSACVRFSGGDDGSTDSLIAENCWFPCYAVCNVHVGVPKYIICVCLYPYAYPYLYLDLDVCMYIYVYICIYMYIYVYICIYMYIYVYICIYMYIYVYICIYVYIYMYIYKWMCIRKWKFWVVVKWWSSCSLSTCTHTLGLLSQSPNTEAKMAESLETH